MRGEEIALVAAAGAAGLWVLGNVARWVHTRRGCSTLVARGEKFRDAALTSMREQAGRLPPMPGNADRIVKMTASELVEAIRNGDLTSLEVTVVFCYRAYNVGHLKLNAVTEAFFDEAIVAAKAADTKRAEAAKKGTLDTLPLLFGLPVSFKDQFVQKGAASTMGCASFAYPHEADGGIVAAFRALGAIPFVRTTAPQMLMLPETMSHLWGTTVNPHSPLRCPGGSSGGEGALIGSYCSPLGVGGDIGGSLRLPAALCGVVSLKGSPLRFAFEGSLAPRVGGVNGNEGVKSVLGTITRNVADTVLGTRAFLSKEMHAVDPLVPRTYLDTDAAAPTGGAEDKRKKLRIGLWPSFGFWEGSTAEARAANNAADALRAAGHEVVDFRMDGQWELDVVRTYYGIMAADGGMRCFREGLGLEPLHSNYHQLLALARLPECLRPLIANALRLVDGVLRSTTAKRLGGLKAKAPSGDAAKLSAETRAAAAAGPMGSIVGPSRLSRVMQSAGWKDTHGYWQLIVKRKQLTRALLTAMKSAQIDAFIAPSPPPAFPHGASKLLTAACVTTFAWNLTHVPAGVVPTTTVREDDRLVDSWSDSLTRATLSTGLYDNAVGMPVGCQIVAPPNEDETVLRLMADVESRVPPQVLPTF